MAEDYFPLMSEKELNPQRSQSKNELKEKSPTRAVVAVLNVKEAF